MENVNMCKEILIFEPKPWKLFMYGDRHGNKLKFESAIRKFPKSCSEPKKLLRTSAHPFLLSVPIKGAAKVWRTWHKCVHDERHERQWRSFLVSVVLMIGFVVALFVFFSRQRHKMPTTCPR